MKKSCSMMSEADEICGLKESLCAQQQLLQQLQNEVEAEREASASAVSEALSVILRLQCEKAAMKMEAEQYKRLSEEKIHHMEQALTATKDDIHRKEMEIAALDCQIQACRHHPGFLRNENLSMNGGGDQSKTNVSSTSIHDILEIPDSDVNLAKDEIREDCCGGGKNVERLDAVKMCDGDEVEWVERALRSTKSEKQSCVSQIKSTLNQVNGIWEIVEAGAGDFSGREEQVKLLNEIKEKLELVIYEIKSLEASESSNTNEESSFSMTILSEAMLHFWL